MNRLPLTYRTAALAAFGISLLLNLIFLIMFFYGREVMMPPEGTPHRPVPEFNLMRIVSHFVENFILLFLLYLVNFKIIRTDFAHRSKVFLVVGFTFLATFVISYALSNISLQLFDFGPQHRRVIHGGMMRDYFLAVIVVFSSQLLYVSYKKQQIALENQTLRAENTQTRYQALKNQLDPHFLFNSFNTLNSLIVQDTGRAQEYVHQLSTVFRYTLQHKDTITFEEELRVTRAFSSLMQIRYGDSLRFDYQIDESFNKYKVVPLSIQTLVENAIKHNVITTKQPLSIFIFTSEDGTVTVENPLQPKKESEPGTGIGLANLAERYRLMWQKEILIRRTEKYFTVTLPLIPD